MKLVKFIKYFFIYVIACPYSARCRNVYLEVILKETAKRHRTRTGQGQQWPVNGVNFEKKINMFIYTLKFDMDRLFACLDDMGGFPDSTITHTPTLYIHHLCHSKPTSCQLGPWFWSWQEEGNIWHFIFK